MLLTWLFGSVVLLELRASIAVLPSAVVCGAWLLLLPLVSRVVSVKTEAEDGILELLLFSAVEDDVGPAAEMDVLAVAPATADIF